MDNDNKRRDQAERLREIVQKANGTNKRRGSPTVITITSGKGGVGKSTIALNLSIKISDLGKTTLLFDADSNLANIDVMMGVLPVYRLADALRGNARYDEVIMSPYPRMKFLAGNSGENGYPKMNVSIQERAIEEIISNCGEVDYIVIDTSAGLNEEIIKYSISSEETIVVTNSEPTSIMDAYAVIKMASIKKTDQNFSILINGVKSEDEAESAAKKLQTAANHFLNKKIDYIGHIPYDIRAQKAVLQQKPLVKIFPRTQASLSISRIARNIAFSNGITNKRSVKTV